MSSAFRTTFALISSFLGILCLGYALYLSQGDPATSRKSDSSTLIAIITFGLTSGLWILAGAVAINGQNNREPRERT